MEDNVGGGFGNAGGGINFRSFQEVDGVRVNMDVFYKVSQSLPRAPDVYAKHLRRHKRKKAKDLAVQAAHRIRQNCQRRCKNAQWRLEESTPLVRCVEKSDEGHCMREETVPCDANPAALICSKDGRPQARGRPRKPLISVVLDDLGVNPITSRRAIGLAEKITLSFLPYAPNVKQQAEAAAAAGHELMLHMPMQPFGHNKDPGDSFLRTDMSTTELQDCVRWAMGQFDGFVGVNNHMGSRFTSEAQEGMATVLAEFQRKGVFFLDSLTASDSVGRTTAAQLDMPHAARDVFLDVEDDPRFIQGQLKELERLAKRNSHAIAIGHPRDLTLEALQKWLPTLPRRGLTLVPLAETLQKNHSRRRTAVAASLVLERMRQEHETFAAERTAFAHGTEEQQLAASRLEKRQPAMPWQPLDLSDLEKQQQRHMGATPKSGVGVLPHKPSPKHARSAHRTPAGRGTVASSSPLPLPLRPAPGLLRGVLRQGRKPALVRLGGTGKGKEQSLDPPNAKLALPDLGLRVKTRDEGSHDEWQGEGEEGDEEEEEGEEGELELMRERIARDWTPGGTGEQGTPSMSPLMFRADMPLGGAAASGTMKITRAPLPPPRSTILRHLGVGGRAGRPAPRWQPMGGREGLHLPAATQRSEAVPELLTVSHMATSGGVQVALRGLLELLQGSTHSQAMQDLHNVVSISIPQARQRFSRFAPTPALSRPALLRRPARTTLKPVALKPPAPPPQDEPTNDKPTTLNNLVLVGSPCSTSPCYALPEPSRGFQSSGPASPVAGWDPLLSREQPWSSSRADSEDSPQSELSPKLHRVPAGSPSPVSILDRRQLSSPNSSSASSPHRRSLSSDGGWEVGQLERGGSSGLKARGLAMALSFFERGGSTKRRVAGEREQAEVVDGSIITRGKEEFESVGGDLERVSVNGSEIQAWTPGDDVAGAGGSVAVKGVSVLGQEVGDVGVLGKSGVGWGCDGAADVAGRADVAGDVGLGCHAEAVTSSSVVASAVVEPVIAAELAHVEPVSTAESVSAPPAAPRLTVLESSGADMAAMVALDGEAVGAEVDVADVDVASHHVAVVQVPFTVDECTIDESASAEPLTAAELACIEPVTGAESAHDQPLSTDGPPTLAMCQTDGYSAEADVAHVDGSVLDATVTEKQLSGADSNADSATNDFSLIVELAELAGPDSPAPSDTNTCYSMDEGVDFVVHAGEEEETEAGVAVESVEASAETEAEVVAKLDHGQLTTLPASSPVAPCKDTVDCTPQFGGPDEAQKGGGKVDVTAQLPAVHMKSMIHPPVKRGWLKLTGPSPRRVVPVSTSALEDECVDGNSNTN